MPLSEFKDLINAKYAIATCGYTRFVGSDQFSKWYLWCVLAG